MWIRALYIAAGGAIGALSRYFVAWAAARQFGTQFAWGTLTVNLGGCLLIGFVFALADQRILLGPSLRLFFMTGFLGALTTFSTYALESVQMFQAGEYLDAAANLALNNLGGLLLVLAGLWLGYRI